MRPRPKTAEQLNQAGLAPTSIALDVTDSAAVDRAADAIVAKYGRVDVLVNNARVRQQHHRRDDYPDDEYTS